MWSKVTVFWNIDRTVKSTFLVPQFWKLFQLQTPPPTYRWAFLAPFFRLFRFSPAQDSEMFACITLQNIYFDQRYILTKIEHNWSKSTKIDQNWPKLTKIDQNRQKLTKIDKNWQKLTNIDKNWPTLTKIGPNWPKLIK